MDLIQVVPSLPPKLDGIGDYARKLAGVLLKSHGIRTHFIVCNPAWAGDEVVDGFRAQRLPERSAAAFLELVSKIKGELGSQETPIFIHFAVYGYQPRGVPFWFVNALEAIRNKQSANLHILFHELGANDHLPWKSGFWLGPLQRRIITQAALTATNTYTNTEVYRSTLERWGSGPVTLVPNFSTMGEPEEYPAWENRTKSLVIFGQAAQRQRAYAAGLETLQAVCERVGIDRILDIGDNLNVTVPKQVGNVPIVQCGRLPEHEVRQAMATSQTSFLAYPVQIILKSSIFAVSRAFGTVPIVYGQKALQTSNLGIEAGEDYVPVSDGDFEYLSKFSMKELSLRVFHKYQLHSSTHAASIFAANLLKASTPHVMA